MDEGPQWADEGGSVLAPGAVLLSSFPSAGLAATVAAHYIVQTIPLPRIGLVRHPGLASIAVVQGGAVQPTIRVHGRPDMGLVLSELPVPPSEATGVARLILDGAERRKVRMLIGLEGVVPHPEGDGSNDDTAEFVWAAVSRSDPALTARLKEAKARILDDGIIGGVSGGLLVEALTRPIPVVVLLVSARPSEEGFPDHRAGAALIETLDRLLPDLKIDTGPLRSRAEMIERALRGTLKNRPSRPTPEPAGPPPEPTIYG